MDEKNISLIDLGVIERLTTRSLVAKVPTKTRQFLTIPKDCDQVEIPAAHELPLPDFIEQEVKLMTLESFVRYVKEFAGDTTQIFGKITGTGCEFLAAIDYHEEGKPNHVAHRARYAPYYSDEFAAWLEISGKGMSQDGLLDHLRRWGYTITNHTDADLIEMISGLEFSVTGTFASKVERVTGGRRLTFNEDIEGRAQAKNVTVPDSLKLESAVFQNGEPFNYEADILYRVSGGRLTIIVELKRIHQTLKDAIDGIVAAIEATTEIKPLIGSIT